MRLDIYGGHKGGGKRVRHVLYVTGADQRWLGEALIETLPDLGRRVLIAQEHDNVVVGRSELQPLRQRLDQTEARLPERLRPVWLSVIDADDAATHE